MKQKPEILPSSYSAEDAPSQEASEFIDPPLPLPVDHALDYLNIQCEQRQLGTPVFLTKCIQRKPGGWLQFFYQVVIKKYPSPFSGLIWIKQDQSVVEDHEKAKNVVALQLLKVLGCPLV